MEQSPVFSKTYDLLQWLIPRTLEFPKSQRFVMALRVQQTALGFYELLVQAGKGLDQAGNLRRADVALEQLRLYLRLCKDLGLLGPRQYEHSVRLTDEIGRLLGGWLKKPGEPKQAAPQEWQTG
jgi:hypothetical protein